MVRGAACRAILAVVCTLAASLVAMPAAATDDVPMTTTLSAPRARHLSSGPLGLVAYDVRHEATGDIATGTRIPGGVIRRADHSQVYDGFWDDAGSMGGWAAPNGVYQFDPTSKVVENSYFIDRLSTGVAGSSVPMAAGDRGELLMGNIARDSFLPFDVERSNPNGTLQWETAKESRTLVSSYGGKEVAVDTMLLRADLVARGGDVDARVTGKDAPQLVIDLPRVYPNGAGAVVGTIVANPASSFVTDFSVDWSSTEGWMTLDVSITGYLYRARERRIGKADVAEWHLPIMIAITLVPPSSPGEARVAASLPGGGRALISSSDDPAGRMVSVAPGGSVLAGTGMPSLITGLAPDGAGDGPEGSGGWGTSCADPCSLVRMDELAQAQAVDATLDAPVALSQGGRMYALTLDPDFRGEGVLAARSARRALSGTPYADAAAVPYVIADGRTVKLERSRLVDLRVVPNTPWANVQVTSQSGGAASRAFGSGLRQGLLVEAVYDLGQELFAFVRFRGSPELGQKPPFELRIEAVVYNIAGPTPVVDAVQYVELPATGPVVYQGETRSTEFSGPASVGTSTAPVEAGAHAFVGDEWLSGRLPAGTLTVVEAGGPLTPAPVADAAASIEGRPLAVYYMAGAESPPWTFPWGIFPRHAGAARIVADGRPTATPCGTPQVTDVPIPDSAPFHDIVDGWLDATPGHLLATMQLRLTNAAALPESTHGYEMRWRDGQGVRYALGTLDERTRWRFTAGSIAADGVRTELAEAGGEVTKPVTAAAGHLRIWIPRDLFGYQDGTVLTGVTAHTWLSTGGQVLEMDAAPNPQASDAVLGGGGSYTVGTCA